MKVLCLCRQGVNRSRYMAEVLQGYGHEAMYAGVDQYAANPVNAAMIEWADIIIAARDAHAAIFKERFQTEKRIISLDITNGIFHADSMRKQIDEQLKNVLPL